MHEQNNWIDASFRSFIPFILISTGNLLIVARILIANRHRKGQMQAARAKDDKDKGGKVRVEFLVSVLPKDSPQF
jgi:hypothetical protein